MTVRIKSYSSAFLNYLHMFKVFICIRNHGIEKEHYRGVILNNFKRGLSYRKVMIRISTWSTFFEWDISGSYAVTETKHITESIAISIWIFHNLTPVKEGNHGGGLLEIFIRSFNQCYVSSILQRQMMKLVYIAIIPKKKEKSTVKLIYI